MSRSQFGSSDSLIAASSAGTLTGPRAGASLTCADGSVPGAAVVAAPTLPAAPAALAALAAFASRAALGCAPAPALSLLALSPLALSAPGSGPGFAVPAA